MSAAIAVVVGSAFFSVGAIAGSASSSHWVSPNPKGELDCNGQSPKQKPVRSMLCTDIRGFSNEDNSNTWGGRFYDNGEYIGHDEPSTTFLSTANGSGNNVTWNYSLGLDPSAAPTGTNPGHDVTHWFELTPAPWASMAICDPLSYPQTPCQAENDGNRPACLGVSCPYNSYPGAGAAFMELQLYPPGMAPFADNISCDNIHWCSALTIDSLECTEGFVSCNTSCEEPVNFAFIQNNGTPTGPPSPQLADVSTFTPNAHTLLMNPGDSIQIHMWDAPLPSGGGKAFKVTIRDVTQGTYGWMQASAANGFMDTSIANCSGTPFNFEPEYNTASAGNYVPWAALQVDIDTEFETGHWESCTSLSDELSPNPFDPYDMGRTYNECHGPYETAGGPEGSETGDGLCYRAGDTHPGYDGKGTSTPPNQMTGCEDNYLQNGDLDFDGQPYWEDWPTGLTPGMTPSSFLESFPLTEGRQYQKYFFQTDIGLSETNCQGSGYGSGSTPCVVPPPGPGHFYPYWTGLKNSSGQVCWLEFGDVHSGQGGNLDTYGKDSEYGSNKYDTLGYPEFESGTRPVTCGS
jgi:hypothetical protein